ncbi:MAG: response regulator [Ignavibacteriales bacterium]|nr:response regulator [Ignavibacteriales bacterium]
MNILLVDDEFSFRTLVKDFLENKGFIIFLAEDGVDGLKGISNNKVDLIISDLHMHRMDGINFCKATREIPAYEDIPFLFISAYGDEDTLGSIKSLRNSAFLSKASPITEIISLIQHLTTPIERGGSFTCSEKKSPEEILITNNQPNENVNVDHEHTKVHILIVDDDDAIRFLLKDMLSEEGYNISTASDGAEAIALLQNDRFNLALLDIIMPNVSGFGVLKFIRENSLPTKVIMLTAYSELKLAVESKMLGADDFIGKPFMRPDLLNTIKQVLGR